MLSSPNVFDAVKDYRTRGNFQGRNNVFLGPVPKNMNNFVINIFLR